MLMLDFLFIYILLKVINIQINIEIHYDCIYIRLIIDKVEKQDFNSITYMT